MEKFKKRLLVSLLMLLTANLFAQRAQDHSVAMADVIEKITTNPATGYENNDHKDKDAFNGSARIYFSTGYRNEVVSLTYETHHSDPQFRFRKTVKVINGVAQITGLRQNLYDVVSVQLKHAKLPGNHLTFSVYSAAYQQIPLGSDIYAYTKNMEGNHMELFKTHLERYQAKLKEMKLLNLHVPVGDVLRAAENNISAEQAVPLSARNYGGGEPCNEAVDWWLDPNYPQGNLQNGLYVYRLYNLCGCYIYFRCIDHNAVVVDANDHGHYIRTGGTLLNNDLTLNPVDGIGQTLKSCGFCASGQNCPGDVPAQCTNPVITNVPSSVSMCAGATLSITATVTGASSYQWQYDTGNGSWQAATAYADGNGSYSGGQTVTITIHPNGTTGYNGLKWRLVAVTGVCISISNEMLLNVSALPSAPSASTVDPTCALATGSITITAVAGATYSFDNGATYQASNTKSGLAPGTYQLKVKNSAGCVSTATAKTIASAPAAPSAPAASSVDPTCALATGSITITAVAGATYSFDNGTTYQASNTMSGLAPGTYQLKVKNAAGCTSAATAKTINAAPAVPSAPTASSVDPTCALATGSITITAVAGATYSFDNGATYQASNTMSGLAPGTYQLKVKSSAGCESAATAKTLAAAPSSTVVTVTTNQTPCSTTAAVLTASGAVSYVWTIGSATGTVVGNTASITVNPPTATNYFVTGTGAGGCTDTKSILVNAPRPSLILTSVITICKGNTQDVIADNNGIAGYTYRWLAPAAVLNVTTPTLYNMAPLVTTSYTVERTTPAGCKDTATSVIRVFEQPVLGTVTKADAGCSTDNGSITINATSPSGLVLEYSINGTTWQTSPVFSNLAPGAYSILVRNQNGVCQAVTGTNVTIARLSGPASGIAAPDRSCANEAIIFDASPAVAGATYLWSTTNNGTGTPAPVITGANNSSIYVVTYAPNNPQSTGRGETVTLTVSLNGCTSTYQKTVNITPPVFALAPPDTSVCRGGQLFLGYAAGIGGPATATYSWAPADKIQGTTSAAQFTTVPLTADQEYTLTVTDPVNGCTHTDKIFVSVNTARNPIANAGPDKVLLALQTATLGSTSTTVTDASSISSYTWNTVAGINGSTHLSDVTDPQPVFTMPSPASAYTYELLVRRQYRSTSTTPGLVCFARDTVVITTPALLQPDLTPRITLNPNNIIGRNRMEITVALNEIAGASTDGSLITMYVDKNPMFSNFAFNPTGTVNASGQPLQNSRFAIDATSNDDYYIITTHALLNNGGTRLMFSVDVNPGATKGNTPFNVYLANGSGGENVFTNNTDQNTLYFTFTMQ